MGQLSLPIMTELTNQEQSEPIQGSSQSFGPPEINVTKRNTENDNRVQQPAGRVVVGTEAIAHESQPLLTGRCTCQYIYVDRFSSLQRTCICKERRKAKRDKRTFTFLPEDAISRWWTRFFGITVNRSQQDRAVEVIQALDDNSEEITLTDNEGNYLRPKTRRHKDSYLSVVVAACKNELPMHKNNEANRLVAKDFINKRMKLHNMRDTDIKQMLPMAVELVFIMNQDEIDALHFRNSNAYINRQVQGSSTYKSRDRPWALNWLGASRTNPVQDGR
jgi:hypothetical protein